MKSKKKIIGICTLAIVLLLGLSSYGVAFGVTSSYWKPDKPLIMNPGQEKDLSLSLQNMVGDDDVTLIAELRQDKRFVTLTDPSNMYEVPAKTKDVKVNFRVIIPKNTPLGTTFDVEIYFVTATDTSGRQVALGTGISKGFQVIIGSEAPQIEAPQPQQPEVVTPTPKKILSEIKPLTKGDMVPALFVLIAILIIWLWIQRAKMKKLKKKAPKGKGDQKKHAPW